MDVKSTFLNGVSKEEIYVEQTLGYMRKSEEKKVLKLKKELYGLKRVLEPGIRRSSHNLRRMDMSSVRMNTLYTSKKYK